MQISPNPPQSNVDTPMPTYNMLLHLYLLINTAQLLSIFKFPLHVIADEVFVLKHWKMSY